MEKPQAVFAQYILPDYYDASIEAAVGRVILLCGQIDRALIEALKNKSKQNLDNKKAIAIVKDHKNGSGMTLGNWLEWFEKEAKKHSIDEKWIEQVSCYIKIIKPTRDRIAHDSLLLSLQGNLEWKTNQSKQIKERDHKDFDMSELTSILNTIYQFRQFLMSYTKA